MGVQSYLWLTLSIFVISLALFSLRLYQKDKDKRKLMYAIGFLSSSLSFILLGLGYVKYSDGNEIANILYRWSGMTYVILLFHVTLELLLRNHKNVNKLFTSFIFWYILSFIIITIGILPDQFMSIIMAIGTFFILSFCIALIIKYKNLTSYLFLFSIISMFIASIALPFISNENLFTSYLSLYAYFISFLFLGMIFFIGSKETKSKRGIESYFSIEKELQETSKQLSETKQNFHHLFNEMIDAVVIVDRKGTILEASDKLYEELGITRDEFIGKNFLHTSFFDAETKKQLIKNVILRLAGKQIPPYEVTVYRKDGKPIPYEIHAGRIMYDGKPADMAIFRNLTERKKIDERLRASEQEKSLLLNSTKELFIYYNKNLQIQWTNKATKDFLHTSDDELKGRYCYDIFFHRSNPCENCPVMRSIESKRPEETEIQTPDGRYWLIRGYPVLDKDQNVVNLVEFLMDITDRKIAEQHLKNAHNKIKNINKHLEDKIQDRTKKILEILEQKDEFIQQLGHDLKNPLGPLVSLIPILKKACDQPKYCEMLEIAERNVYYMKNLVKKTLELAQLDSPNTTLTIQPLNLYSEVNTVIHNHFDNVTKKHTTILNNISRDITIKADKHLLHEVFNNLIHNAITYSHDDAIITIDATHDDSDIIISVKDTGIGLTPDQINQVFDELYKADEARHDFSNTGLGLSISKKIIQKHGGRMWAESQGLGKGSTFFFTLPLRSQHRHASKKPHKEIPDDIHQKIDILLTS